MAPDLRRRSGLLPTTEDNYFPDFITLYADGTLWLIEGKSDKNAKDADDLRKCEAAEKWARHIRDTGDHGTWCYMFATETDIKQAAGSWQALMVTTQPE